jgi:murein DD-endopeptidase MepM/ murein hydrolase activator NlpD
MDKKAKTYTIMIIPDRNRGKTFSACLPRNVLILLMVSFSILLCGAALLMIKSAEAAKKLQYFSALRNDNEILTKENNRLRLIYQKIGRIDSISSYLEKLSALSQPQERAKSNNKIGDARIRKTAGDTTKGTGNDKNILVKRNAEKESDKSLSGEEISELHETTVPSILPVEGWITQQFHDDTMLGSTIHPGIDIAAAEGVMIKAPAPGVVLDIEVDQYYGNLIIIKHDNEFVTRYGHCAKVFVAKNERVERGQTIALVGNTGHSSAPHLHFEVIKNGKNINPLEVISSAKK